MEIYTLSKEIEYDGEIIRKIEMDLEDLSAKDLEKCEKEARMLLNKKESMPIPETNKKYLACVAAKAAGVRSDLIFSLKGKDYTQVTLLVQNFLLDGDSDSEENTDTEMDRSSSMLNSRKEPNPLPLAEYQAD